MSAGLALQEAIASALAEIEELTGIYDGPPPRAAYPYAAIDAGTELDWSHKSGAGRELLVAVTLWDDQPLRLSGLADGAEKAMGSLGALGGWSLVSLRLLKRRTVRDVAGPWAVGLDFRARVLAQD